MFDLIKFFQLSPILNADRNESREASGREADRSLKGRFFTIEKRGKKTTVSKNCRKSNLNQKAKAKEFKIALRKSN